MRRLGAAIAAEAARLGCGSHPPRPPAHRVGRSAEISSAFGSVRVRSRGGQVQKPRGGRPRVPSVARAPRSRAASGGSGTGRWVRRCGVNPFVTSTLQKACRVRVGIRRRAAAGAKRMVAAGVGAVEIQRARPRDGVPRGGGMVLCCADRNEAAGEGWKPVARRARRAREHLGPARSGRRGSGWSGRRRGAAWPRRASGLIRALSGPREGCRERSRRASTGATTAQRSILPAGGLSSKIAPVRAMRRMLGEIPQRCELARGCGRDRQRPGKRAWRC